MTDGIACNFDLSALAVGPGYGARIDAALAQFARLYGHERMPLVFSAPGRVELGGNHTDHQRGCVVAAAINMDALGVAAPNGLGEIRIASEGYPSFSLRLGDLSPQPEERNTTPALVRGVCNGFIQRGHSVGGFDAYIQSDVRSGSGLSSSAAFEALLGRMLSELYSGGAVGPVEIAQIGQYAENVYFGKPSGLMDQTACAVGGVVFIDFGDPAKPVIREIPVDFPGHALCVVDSGGSHAELTHEYAAITEEMRQIAGFFRAEVLSQLTREQVLSALPHLRQCAGDRAVLRALHFFAENQRAQAEAEALSQSDFASFLSLAGESGRSSFMYLQNISPAGAVAHQDVAVALALCDALLGGRGAFRVQGGGFAGTVEAFVPEDMLDSFRAGVEAALGAGACHVLRIRPAGSVLLRRI